MTVDPEAGTATALRAEDAARADQAGSAANADRARSAVSADSAASARDADRLDDKNSTDFAAADHPHPAVVRKASRTLTSEEFVFEFVKMCQPGERAIGGDGGIMESRTGREWSTSIPFTWAPYLTTRRRTARCSEAYR